LIVYFVNYFIARLGGPAWQEAYAWRWMFASGVVPSGIFLGLLQLVPESPRWLAENGRRDEAIVTLTKIDGAEHAPTEINSIEAAIEFERQSIKAIYTVDKLGRKPLLLLGALGMCICLVSMGAAAQAGHLAAWLLIFVLGYIACFVMSVGPVTWVVLSEIFSTKIRGRAMLVATFGLWTANFIVSQTFPIMDSNSALIRQFDQLFLSILFAGTIVLCLNSSTAASPASVRIVLPPDASSREIVAAREIMR
jgi:MFS family permease